MPSRRIFVRLRNESFNALIRVAESERRHPSDQAAILLERALRDLDPPPTTAKGEERP